MWCSIDVFGKHGNCDGKGYCCESHILGFEYGALVALLDIAVMDRSFGIVRFENDLATFAEELIRKKIA